MRARSPVALDTSVLIAALLLWHDHDALIAACARAAGAWRLLTLNERDFAAVAPDLDLIVP